MRCALVPYHPSVNSPVTELELLFIDEQVLTLIDLIRVTHSHSEPCATSGKLHMDMVSLSTSALPVFFGLFCDRMSHDLCRFVNPMINPQMHIIT